MPHGDTLPVALAFQRTKDAPSLRVLVVDDYRDGADAMAALLTCFGHVTRVACDGMSAVETAKDFNPQVVLLDVGLPDINGYEVARRIHACTTAPVTLIAVTGWVREEDRTRAFAAGIDAHLAKPADPSVLQALLAGIAAGS